MSIAQNPLMGSMRKSMGNFTTMSYNGRNIVRSKAFNLKRKISEAQEEQIQRFSALAGVYNSFGGIIGEGFVENRKGLSAYNRFISANFKTAFTVTGNGAVINYPRLLISKGSLPGVKVSGSVTGGDGITIRYETQADLPVALPTDMVVAFAEMRTGKLLLTRQERGSEETGSILIPCTNVRAEEIVCCYLFARSADGKKSSDSAFVAVE